MQFAIVERLQDVSERFRLLRALDRGLIGMRRQKNHRHPALPPDHVRCRDAVHGPGQADVHQHQRRSLPAGDLDRFLAGAGRTGYFVAQFPELVGNVCGDDRFVFNNQNGGITHDEIP